MRGEMFGLMVVLRSYRRLESVMQCFDRRHSLLVYHCHKRLLVMLLGSFHNSFCVHVRLQMRSQILRAVLLR